MMESTAHTSSSAVAELSVDDGDLDDLMLDDGEAKPPSSATGAAPAAAATAEAAAADDADPWAVLAAAAGEEALPPSPPKAAATTATTGATVGEDHPLAPETAAPEVLPGVATAVPLPGSDAPALSSAQGENFSLPPAAEGSKPSLADQIQASTAHLTQTLGAKLHEVDERHNLSANLSARAKEFDEQHRVTEKWTNFNATVLKPTTAKTVERTRELSGGVKDRVGPPLREGWGSLRQRTTEMGIAAKWGSLTKNVGSKWNETRETVGENVAQWREEQERRRAVENAAGGENGTHERGAGGGGGLQQGLQGVQANLQKIDLEQTKEQLGRTKEKVAASWSRNVSWVKQRLEDSKLSSEVGVPPSRPPAEREAELQMFDSDGLPSSFRRE